MKSSTIFVIIVKKKKLLNIKLSSLKLNYDIQNINFIQIKLFNSYFLINL